MAATRDRLQLAQAAAQPNNATNNDDGAIAELFPQLYGKISPADGFLPVLNSIKWILLLLFGTLTLGFIYQYRRADVRRAEHDAGD